MDLTIVSFVLYLKEFAGEIEKQFICIRENTEKYITFIVTIGKEVTRFNENGEEITKIIPYILQLIDSTGFMASSLSNLVNIFSKIIDKIKCKYDRSNEKYETCVISYESCN